MVSLKEISTQKDIVPVTTLDERVIWIQHFIARPSLSTAYIHAILSGLVPLEVVEMTQE